MEKAVATALSHTPDRNRKKRNGDDRHKERLIERCDTAVNAIKDAKFKDEIACDAIQFAFEILFDLIGHLPNNWQNRRAHHSHVTSLTRYRTFAYVGTARQQAQRVTDAAYYNRLPSTEPNFETLINKLKRDFSDDPDRFLAWLRAEHRSLYDRYI
jgi:hypothetical protein